MSLWVSLSHPGSSLSDLTCMPPQTSLLLKFCSNNTSLRVSHTNFLLCPHSQPVSPPRSQPLHPVLAQLRSGWVFPALGVLPPPTLPPWVKGILLDCHAVPRLHSVHAYQSIDEKGNLSFSLSGERHPLPSSNWAEPLAGWCGWVLVGASLSTSFKENISYFGRSTGPQQ